MFFRVATIRRAGTTYRYLQLCEAVRVNGRPTDRVLFSLGNLDRFAPGTLANLSDSLAKLAGDTRVRASTLATERVWEYGALAAVVHLWDQFGLSERLRRLWAGRCYRSFDAVPYLQLMVANRLIKPRSKLGVHAWAERVALPTTQALAAPAAEPPRPLQHYYRALDDLLAVKQPLEEELWSATKNLFNLELDLVFYDLTSTYFEGDGPDEARFGYSRDHRPDLKQVVVALACDRQGFPIAHEVLPGNRADVTTLLPMVEQLRQRFAIRRCVFVADNGMVSKDNLAALDAAGYGYVVALKREQWPGTAPLLATPLEDYQPAGHGLKVVSGQPDDQGQRLVCCYSEVRAAEQRQIREARIARAQAELERLQASVAAGHVKAPAKIVARAARHLTLAKATRYFTYEAPARGVFTFALRQDVVDQQQANDGKYFLLAKAPGMALEPADIVDAYYTLQEVERAFRDMKDFLKLRPIYHWTGRRVEAHIFACVLAYLLEKTLGARLRKAGLILSAREALDQLGTMHLVESRLGDATIRTISRPSPQVQAVLKAIDMPLPPTVVSTLSSSPAAL